MTHAKDYYSILSVSEDASLDQIKKAYRSLALKYHPDRAKTEDKKQAEEKFKEISEAYYVLSDEKRRREYDEYRQGYRSYSGSDFAQAQGFDFNEVLKHFAGFGGRSRGVKSRDFSEPMFDFEDIFNTFEHMNDGSGRYYTYNFGDSPGDGESPAEDTDIQASIKIPGNVLTQGGEVKFSHKGRQLTLKIKPGTISGQRLRLKEQGKPCKYCRHPGDLIVTVFNK